MEKNMKLDWKFNARGDLEVTFSRAGLHTAVCVDASVTKKRVPAGEAMQVLLRELSEGLKQRERREARTMPSICDIVRVKGETEDLLVTAVDRLAWTVTVGPKNGGDIFTRDWEGMEYAP